MEDKDKIIDCTKPFRLPDDCNKVRKNFTQGYFYREIGRYNNVIPSEFQWAAEDKLINKSTFEEIKCQLPYSPRSTFLMVFSPDGKRIASTHGNHNVYVTDLTTGKNIKTLSGHPRTPWCVAFHPSSNQILASGCLGGQVRVWDLHGGSEVWTTESHTVIASLAFHPVDRMLVIATYNELHFWDWSQPKPFAKCSTKSAREKVRYVSFDRLGNKLITGIANPVNVPSQWDRINLANSQPPSTTAVSTAVTSSTLSNTVANTQASTDQGRSINFCYRHLMNQYNQLVNRYFDLSRSRITPTIDRGTDPMDLLDLRNSGSASENTATNPSPSSSNSHSNSSSPLRFKITRSASRTYRPLSSRERFRIHSSIFSRLNSRSSLPPNPRDFSATSSLPSNQHSTFTAPPSISSPSTSLQSTPRFRRCAFSLGPTSRTWCLTFSPESSSNAFFTRNASPSNSSSGAVTNPTYTSHTDRGILSTRESVSNNSGSRLPAVWPCGVFADETDDHRLTIRRTERSNDGGNDPDRSGNANCSFEGDANRCDSRSATRVASSAKGEAEWETRRSRSGFRHSRRQRRDVANSSGIFARDGEPPDSNGDFVPRETNSSATFQSTPVDLRRSNPERRFAENDSFEEKHSSENENRSSSRSLLHPRPVPRVQVRSRLNQEPTSQLHMITNRETHGLNLQNNSNLRRQLSFRLGGQFVLSRHSNSPFQPRSPHQINHSRRGNNSNPLFYPCGNSRSSSAEGNSSTSSEENNFSAGSIASNLSFAGELPSSRRTRDQNKTRLFDRVEMMLRDRMRNSSEVPSIDSTVNYSQISGETDADVRTRSNLLDSDDVNFYGGLGPRGTDPMLSSTSENRDGSNDGLFLGENPTSISAASSSRNGDGFYGSRNESEIPGLWDSEAETSVPFSLNSDSPLGDILNEEPQPERRNDPRTFNADGNPEAEGSGPNRPPIDEPNSSSAEFNMRQGLQRLSLHIENLQKLCWTRIEILQRQKIRGMWENLTKQMRQFQNAIQARAEGSSSGVSNRSDSSDSRSDLPNLSNLAIDNTESRIPTQATSASSNYGNVVNDYKKIVESMVNELFSEARKWEKVGGDDNSNRKSGGERNVGGDVGGDKLRGTSTRSGEGCSRNEEESRAEPEPGPSGLSAPGTSRGTARHSLSKNENLKMKLYKVFVEALQRDRRRRDARSFSGTVSGGSSRQNHGIRLRNGSRAKFRLNFRHGRHILDFFASKSKTINRELEALLKSRKKERVNGRMSNPSTSRGSSGSIQPFPSTSRHNSRDACQSCGQKKKPIKDCGSRQKRRFSSDSFGGEGTSGSAPKMSKSESGVSGEGGRSEGNGIPFPSSSTQDDFSCQRLDNSTNELLKQMIQTMETMLRFLREAFSRTEEELAGSRGGGQRRRRRQEQHQQQNQESTALLSSDDGDEANNSNEQANSSADFPQNFRCTKEIIENLMRDVTQLRAKKLLNFMVKSLTQFFGKNFGTLIQVLDEQIFSLCMLLYLALELTDLLLDQLNARSRDSEETSAVDNEDVVSVDGSKVRNSLLSRSRIAAGRRSKCRNPGRSSCNQTFTTSQDDNSRCGRGSANFTFPSNSRSGSARCNSSDLPATSSNDGSNAFLFDYVRRKRRMSRTSTSLPSEWSGRNIGRTSAHSSPGSSTANRGESSSNGNGNNNLLCFRIDRRGNEEEESFSTVRAFDNESGSDNSYSSNSNNNNNNNNSDSSNDTNNNYSLNNCRRNSYYGTTTTTTTTTITTTTTTDRATIMTTSNSGSSSISNNNNGNRNGGSTENSTNNVESGSNFLNHYFPGSNSSSSDGGHNNIIIVTSLSSDNDVTNSFGGRLNSGRNNGGNDGNASRPSGSNSSFTNQNSPTPLRSMELTLSRSESGDLSLRDERPILWIRCSGNGETSGSSNANDSQSRVNTFTVPVVHVNDIPVSDVSMLNQPRHRPQSPVPRVPEDVGRWRAWRSRLLHPRYSGPNPVEDQDSNDLPENIHYYRILSTSAGSHHGVNTLDPMIITDAPISPRHRIQAWDFSKMNIPDISDREANSVVPECKIHNDASVDVSNDGHLLVTLLPSGRLSLTTMLGVYSLDWSSLGQLLYRTSFQQNALSVSLSPTNRHLLVGLASRPVILGDIRNMAQIFRLEGGRPSSNGESWQSGSGRLVHMRDLEPPRESYMISINCIRWAPGVGQGLVYGTNTGQLRVLR